MTFEQIINKLKTIFNKVDDFAYEERPYNIEDYPEAVEAKKVRENFSNLHRVSWKWDTQENQILYEKLPNEYTIAERLWNESRDLYWTEVEQVGGEGEGDHWHSVKYFPDHDIYIKVTGFYQSYDGTEFYDGWDCCKEVRPQEKTITVYQ